MSPLHGHCWTRRSSKGREEAVDVRQRGGTETGCCSCWCYRVMVVVLD